jgi:hypothetical protein
LRAELLLLWGRDHGAEEVVEDHAGNCTDVIRIGSTQFTCEKREKRKRENFNF